MRIILPDGKVAEFPDDMPPEQIESVLQQQFPPEDTRHFDPALQGESQQPEGAVGAPISTITGQQMPTMDEAMGGYEKARGLFREALPIAGDIAGTVLAPQLTIPRLGSKMIRAANIGLKALGAGAGGATGELAGQAAYGESPDLMRAAKQGGVGAAVEVGMPIAGAVAKGVKPVLNLASDMTSSGRRIKTALRHKLQDRTTEKVSNMLVDMAPGFVKEAGSDLGSLSRKIDAAFDETRVFYEAAEKQIDEAAKATGGLIRMPAAEDMLTGMMQAHASKGGTIKDYALKNAVVREFGIKPGEYNATVLRKLMDGEPITTADAKHIMATVMGGEKWGKLGPSHQSLREKLKTTVKDDIANLTGDAGLRETADAQWKALKRFNFVKSLYDRSTYVMPNTAKEILDPAKFSDLIYKNEKRILRDSPELWPILKEEADYMVSSIVPRLRELGTMPGESIYGAGLGFAFGGVAGVPIAEGIGAASALALMTKPDQQVLKGLLAIKEGIKPVIRGGSKIGLHLKASHE